jgi:hypothetical protein
MPTKAAIFRTPVSKISRFNPILPFSASNVKI